MCTVTYIGDNDDFTITFSRDEKVFRPTASIAEWHRIGNKQFFFPRDEKALGTWIAIDSLGNVACLLNGGLGNHVHTPPYKKSRGIVLLDSFEYETTNTFSHQYSFVGIEPFTLLLFRATEKVELIWTGDKLIQKSIDSKSALWCSATLYSLDTIDKRRAIFNQFLKDKKEKPTPQELIEFHQSAKIGDPENDFIMKREGGIQTLSVTSVQKKKDDIVMNYFPLGVSSEIPYK